MRLKCSWEYDGNASHVEFHVRWIGDEMNPNRRIDKMFNGTDEREYLYQHENVGRTGPPVDSHNYAFNKEVCTTSYYR